MVGCGLYPDVQSAADILVSTSSTVEPDKKLVELYEERYQKFRKIYPAMKGLFSEII